MTRNRGAAAGWTGLGAGGAFLVTAAILLTRTLRPTLEAREYISDIEGATGGAERNMKAFSKLGQTRELSAVLARRLEGAPEGAG